MAKWSSRAARFRASVLAEGRAKVMKNVIPRTQEMLDNYVKGRRGEVISTSIRWERILLAFCLAGLIAGGCVGLHKVFP